MDKTALQNLGKKLKELRKVKGLTQEDLAEKVDIHQTYVVKLDSGKIILLF